VSTITFDTHAYVKKLKAVGFTEEQAEVQAETLAAIIESDLATKRDLKELETNLRRDLAELKADMVRWVAGLLVAQATLIIAALKLL
jgi:hypothetical protein